MMVSKIRALAGVGLLLVMVQICLAAERPDETFDAIWTSLGQKAETELAALTEKGRTAFRSALIACSLYADEYDSAKYKNECERTSKAFSIDFGDRSPTVSLLLRSVMALTSAHETQTRLDFQQGRRGIADNNARKTYVGVLQKAYHETKHD